MLDKMKKKIGFALRIFGYQVAMSIFALMITTPVFNRPLYRIFTSVFSILLYFVLVYFTAHDLGAKDYVGRNNPVNPPKAVDGFVYCAMSQVINLVFIILYLLVPGSFIALYLGNFMYCPLNFIHIQSAADLDVTFNAIWYLVSCLPQIAVGGIAYLFGYKGIFISKIFKLDTKEINANPNEDNPTLDE